MPIGNTVKHGWILLLCVPLYITKRSEAVLQWRKRKNIQIFYPILLTCKKLHGIFILGKMEII